MSKTEVKEILEKQLQLLSEQSNRFTDEMLKRAINECVSRLQAVRDTCK